MKDSEVLNKYCNLIILNLRSDIREQRYLNGKPLNLEQMYKTVESSIRKYIELVEKKENIENQEK